MAYIKKYIVRVTMELEANKMPMFKPTLSIVMVLWVLQWERCEPHFWLISSAIGLE